jgi:hypothetical protein
MRRSLEKRHREGHYGEWTEWCPDAVQARFTGPRCLNLTRSISPTKETESSTEELAEKGMWSRHVGVGVGVELLTAEENREQLVVSGRRTYRFKLYEDS